MTDKQTGPLVYKAVNAVQAALAKSGISKDRKASGGGATYAFRGIDDVYSHLAPLLAEHGLCVFPRCISREVTERATRNGGALFVAVVHAEFDFVATADGSKHTAATFGEAMDSSDKATNKAMSAAFKYAAFMTFCIPTEGDNDADATSHEIAGRDAPAMIDSAQISDLQGKIEGYGLNLGKILQHYKIKQLTEIPAEEFANVTKQLDVWYDKKTQMEQKGSRIMQTITISGNVGNDAELRTVRDKPVLNFNVGVKNGFGKDAGSVWYRCALWGNAATAFADRIKKGTKVFVTGALIHDEYEGKPQYKIDVRDIDTAPRSGDAPKQAAADNSGFGGDDLDDSVPF